MMSKSFEEVCVFGWHYRM